MWQQRTLRNKQFDNHNKQDEKIIKNTMFILCACVRVCVCRKYSYDQLNKNMICSPVCACVHITKVYWINVSIVSRNNEDKILTLLTYICMRVCIYVRGRKLWAFCFLKFTHAFFMIFGDYVSRSSSRQKNVACFVVVSSVRCLRLSVLTSRSGMP